MPLVLLRPMIKHTTWAADAGGAGGPVEPFGHVYAQVPVDGETLNANLRALFSLVNGGLSYPNLVPSATVPEAKVFIEDATVTDLPVSDIEHNHDGYGSALLGPSALKYSPTGANLGGRSYGAVRSCTVKQMSLWRTTYTLTNVPVGLNTYTVAVPVDLNRLGLAGQGGIATPTFQVRVFATIVWPDAGFRDRSILGRLQGPFSSVVVGGMFSSVTAIKFLLQNNNTVAVSNVQVHLCVAVAQR